MEGLGRRLSLTPGHPQRSTVATMIVLVVGTQIFGIDRIVAGDVDNALIAFFWPRRW